jgi:DNA-binding transcriptional LysR family regulator
VLGRLARAERTADDLATGRRGTVRLATTPGAPGLVRALLSHQNAAHPDVRVELVRARHGPKLHAILSGEIDAALVHSAPTMPGLAFTEIWREPWRPVVSAAHRLAGGETVELRALAHDPLVLVAGEGTGGLRDQFLALCRRAGFEPSTGPTHATLGDALVEIAQSTGWTLLRASNTRDIERLGVVALSVDDELPPAQLWLAHRVDPAPPIRSLVALAARLHGEGRLVPPPGDAGGPEE